MKVRTDQEKIAELLGRSVDAVYPSREFVQELLGSGQRLTVYAGVDPTGPSLHLGHAMNYLLLKRFHDLGHRIIVLVGDFTAMIGDPSDKTAVRVQLSPEEIVKNLQGFKEQIGRLLPFDDTENPIEFKFNSEWLGALSFYDLITIASHFTVQQMIERDNFRRRLADRKPLYVHELFYPLMQGYDSVMLSADGEVGGTDQTFNMLAGRDLVRAYQNREKFVITHPLLLSNPKASQKMSKSEGTGIFLDSSPGDMYGGVMSLPDEAIPEFFIHCTTLSWDEARAAGSTAAADPREAKMHLAREITTLYHGREAAREAERVWLATFSEGVIPEDIPAIPVADGTRLGEALVAVGIVESKSEFRRLITEGAVRENGETKIDDPNFIVSYPLVLKVGKRRFVKIILEGK